MSAIRSILLLALLLLPSVAWAEAPVALYTDIIAGPKTGGENNNGCYLSIFGKNFGSDIDDITVTVGGGEVVRYIYLGVSNGRTDIQQLSVQLGPAVATGAIKVTVNGVDSNTDLTFTVSPGDIYFVSKTGNDSTGTGSISNPYRTASKVQMLPAFGPGDFLIIRGGTYVLTDGTEGVTYYGQRWLHVWAEANNTASQQTNVIGYPGEFPIIDWGTYNEYDLDGININGENKFVTVAGFEMNLRDSGAIALRYGFYSNPKEFCNDCRVVNMKVTGGMKGKKADGTIGYGGVSPVLMNRSTRLKFLGNTVGPTRAVYANGSHMVYISHFYDEADVGWNVLRDQPYGRAAMQFAGDTYGAAPWSYERGTWGRNSNVHIHDNLFKNLGGSGVLFNLGSYGPFYIYNNIFDKMNTWERPGISSIAFRGAQPRLGVYYFYNNTVSTIANATTGSGVFQLGLSGTWPEKVEFRNNIIKVNHPTLGWYYTVNDNTMKTEMWRITGANNLWYGSNAVVPPFETGARLSADPKFYATDDFHLQVDSPAIDAGNSSVSLYVDQDYDALPRPQGAAWDIGALEYASGYTPPATCSSFTYTDWSTCINLEQRREIATASPAGCVGGTPDVLTQVCTPNACTSFTYTPWTPQVCTEAQTQTRSVISSAPSGCVGGTPLLTQTCYWAAPTLGYGTLVLTGSGGGNMTIGSGGTLTLYTP